MIGRAVLVVVAAALMVGVLAGALAFQSVKASGVQPESITCRWPMIVVISYVWNPARYRYETRYRCGFTWRPQ